MERDNGTAFDISDEMDREQVQNEQPTVFESGIDMIITSEQRIEELTGIQRKRGMWVDHLLAKKRTRGSHTSETIIRFVESSAELNCVMVCHGSQESQSDSNVYKERGSQSPKRENCKRK